MDIISHGYRLPFGFKHQKMTYINNCNNISRQLRQTLEFRLKTVKSLKIVTKYILENIFCVY